jgi:TRAP transporter TAXI family solute receptor
VRLRSPSRCFPRLVSALLLLNAVCWNLPGWAGVENDSSLACAPGMECDHDAHITTGSPDGAYYKIGCALARFMRVEHGANIGVWKSNGSIQNLSRVETGTTAVLGFVQSDVVDHRHGRGPYDSLKFKVVGTVHHEPLHVLVRRRLQFSSIDQFRGNRVAVGADSSGTQFTAYTILGVFGISPSQIEAYSGNYDSIGTWLSGGVIDAAFVVNADVPDTIRSALQHNEADVMQFRTADLVKMAARSPRLYALREATDPKRGREYRTISVTSVLIGNDNVAPDLAGSLAETLLDGALSTGKEHSYRRYVGNDSIDWVREPFRLFGRLPSKGVFSPEAIEAYKRNPRGKAGPFYVHPYKYSFLHTLWRGRFSIGLLLFNCVLVVGSWSASRRKQSYANRFVLGLFVLSALLLVLVSIPFSGLYFAESRVGNPDISGNGRGLMKMVQFIAGSGDVAVITREGRFIRYVAFLLASLVGVGAIGRSGVVWAKQRLQEVLKVVPKAISDHVIICNWTTHTSRVIDELRSDVLLRQRPILIFADERKNHPEVEACLRKHAKVYFVPGVPFRPKAFDNEELHVDKAEKVVILARDCHDYREPIRIFWQLMNRLESRRGRGNRQFPEKPRSRLPLVVGGLMRPLDLLLRARQEQEPGTARPRNLKTKQGGWENRSYKDPDCRLREVIVELLESSDGVRESLHEHGRDNGVFVEVLSVGELAPLRLAQAVANPVSSAFVREVLTATKNSNEVYALAFSRKYVEYLERTLDDWSFQSFAATVARDCGRRKGTLRSSKDGSIVVIGVSVAGDNESGWAVERWSISSIQPHWSSRSYERKRALLER